MTETIVKIVPMGDLIAYLEIPSSEIGFRKRMEVEINIDSYPSTDFGVLEVCYFYNWNRCFGARSK